MLKSLKALWIPYYYTWCPLGIWLQPRSPKQGVSGDYNHEKSFCLQKQNGQHQLWWMCKMYDIQVLTGLVNWYGGGGGVISFLLQHHLDDDISSGETAAKKRHEMDKELLQSTGLQRKTFFGQAQSHVPSTSLFSKGATGHKLCASQISQLYMVAKTTYKTTERPSLTDLWQKLLAPRLPCLIWVLPRRICHRRHRPDFILDIWVYFSIRRLKTNMWEKAVCHRTVTLNLGSGKDAFILLTRARMVS